MPEPRLPITKTYKLVIGGQFPRSESGRALALKRGETFLTNYCQASRKDAREAVVAARRAQGSWAAKTAYNRGQILYRMAEVLEQRSPEFVHELEWTGSSESDARAEVAASIDRLVHYAGWADKVTALVGSVNPVASSYFNFSVPEPMGVVAIIAPDTPALLACISLIAPAIVMGNTCVLVASETNPLSAITWGEVLATSDLPGGVVNVLTGLRDELLPPLASHMDVNALLYAAGNPEQAALAQREGAHNVKRVVIRNWDGEGLHLIEDTLEIKTAWHPIGA